MLGSLRFPKAIVASVIFAVLFVVVLVLVQPYAPPIPQSPYVAFTIRWIYWWLVDAPTSTLYEWLLPFVGVTIINFSLILLMIRDVDN